MTSISSTTPLCVSIKGKTYKVRFTQNGREINPAFTQELSATLQSLIRVIGENALQAHNITSGTIKSLSDDGLHLSDRIQPLSLDHDLKDEFRDQLPSQIRTATKTHQVWNYLKDVINAPHSKNTNHSPPKPSKTNQPQPSTSKTLTNPFRIELERASMNKPKPPAPLTSKPPEHKRTKENSPPQVSGLSISFTPLEPEERVSTSIITPQPNSKKPQLRVFQKAQKGLENKKPQGKATDPMTARERQHQILKQRYLKRRAQIQQNLEALQKSLNKQKRVQANFENTQRRAAEETAKTDQKSDYALNRISGLFPS